MKTFNLSEISIYEIAGRKCISGKITTDRGEIHVTEWLLQSQQGQYYVNRHDSNIQKNERDFLFMIFTDYIFGNNLLGNETRLKNNWKKFVPAKEIYDALDREIDAHKQA